MYCIKCGTKLVPEARYCVSCGSAVDSGESIAKKESPTKHPPMEEISGTRAAEKERQTVAKKNQNVSGNLIGLGVFLVAMVGIIIVASEMRATQQTKITDIRSGDSVSKAEPASWVKSTNGMGADFGQRCRESNECKLDAVCYMGTCQAAP
jgi:uncharacterized membrane protein YvbJ